MRTHNQLKPEPQWRRYSATEKARVVEYAAATSQWRAAERFGVSQRSVGLWMRDAGVPARRRSAPTLQEAEEMAAAEDALSVCYEPEVSEEVQRGAEELLNELESSCLEVILVPQRHYTNEGGMIRCAASKNALWYRQFCEHYRSSRRRGNNAVDTSVKRSHTVRGLRELMAGRCASVYAERLLPWAKARANPSRKAVA